MTCAWAPLIKQTLKDQACWNRLYVSSYVSCEISEFFQTEEALSLDGTSAEKLFYVRAALYNLDGRTPAWATFMMPSTLPLGGLSRYTARWSPYNKAYWILDDDYVSGYQSFGTQYKRVVSNASSGATLHNAATAQVQHNRVVSNAASEATLYDPAIVRQGSVKGKTSIRHPSGESTRSQQTDAEKDMLAEQSKALLRLIKRTCSGAVSADPESDAVAEAQESASLVIAPTSYIAALDLAKSWWVEATMREPDNLDLALDNVQEKDLIDLLEAVQRGRLGTVAETLAEAYGTKLSKSQKKRQREGAAKKRRALRLAAVEEAALHPEEDDDNKSNHSEAVKTDGEPANNPVQISEETENLPSTPASHQAGVKALQDHAPTIMAGAPVQPAAPETADSSYIAPFVDMSDEVVKSPSTGSEISQPPLERGTADRKPTPFASVDLDLAFGKLPERWEDSEDDEPKTDVDGHERGITKKGNVAHTYVYSTEQHLRPLGFVQIRILQEADRSLEWFLNSSYGENASSAQVQGSLRVDGIDGQGDAVDVIQSESQLPEYDFHHLNFLWRAVHTKSATPPEVSMWAALTCKDILEKHGKPRDCSRKAVLVTQAWKYVDPWTYSGPEELLSLDLATLRDAVIGLVDKVYIPQGNWIYDGYDEDENIPRSSKEVQVWHRWYTGQAEFYHCIPHQIDYSTPDDSHCVVVKKGSPTCLHGESKLRHVRNAEEVEHLSKELVVREDSTPESVMGNFNQSTSDAKDQDAAEERAESDFTLDDELGPGKEVTVDVDNVANVDSAESDEESLRESSIIGSPRKALLRKEEWRSDFLESPERFRNRFSGAENIPGFRPRVDEEIYTDSEASTEVEVEHGLSPAAEHFYNAFGHDIDAVESAALLENEGDLDAPRNVHDGLEPVLPETRNAEAAETSNDDSGSRSSGVDADLSLDNDTPITPLTPWLPVNAQEVQDEVSPKFPIADSERASEISDRMSSEVDYEGVAEMMETDPPLIAEHGDTGNSGISNTRLLQAVQAIASSQAIEVPEIVFELDNEGNDESTVEQLQSAECAEEQISAEPEHEQLRFIENHFDVSRTSVASSECSGSGDLSLQMVLYEPEPQWAKVLKFCSRLLKRASETMHRRESNDDQAMEQDSCGGNLMGTEQMLQAECQEFYLGKSTLWVGKQGIRVGSAAIAVGLLPVHAGVLAAKAPFKAANTTWKVGKWAWKRAGG